MSTTTCTASTVPAMAWNTSGTLSLSLASRHDAGFNYVTVNTRSLIRNGLIPMPFEEFSKKFKQGDTFLIQLNGQVNVCAKLNRANLATMAFHCPKIVRMPVWNVDRSEIVEVDAFMCGFAGLQIGTIAQDPAEVKPKLDRDYAGAIRTNTPLEARSITITGDNLKINEH